MTDSTIDRHFHPRLYEREEIAAEAYLPVVPEITAGKFIKRTFQVAQRDMLVHRHPVYLVEHPAVRGIHRFIPVNPSRFNHADGRFHRRQRPGGYRRGMRMEQQRLLCLFIRGIHPKSRHIITRGMLGGHIQSLEIKIVQFHFRPLGNLETHRDENIADFLQRLGQDMQTPDRRFPARQ